jgi:hypothetical protein
MEDWQIDHFKNVVGVKELMGGGPKQRKKKGASVGI